MNYSRQPVLLSVVASLALLAAATPALADHRKTDHRHRHDAYDDQRRVTGHARYGYSSHHAPTHRGHVRYEQHHRYDSHARHAFVVPHEIHRAIQADYVPYHHGATWYRPHRHHHEVYYFPVQTEHGYAYRPHYYCEGSLVDLHPAYRGSRFSIRVSF
jgi:hypothetical protein